MSEPIRRVARVRVFARLHADPGRRMPVLSPAPLGSPSAVGRNLGVFLDDMRRAGTPDAIALVCWYVTPQQSGRTAATFICRYASDTVMLPVPSLPGLARDYLAREISAWQGAGYAQHYSVAPMDPEDDAS